MRLVLIGGGDIGTVPEKPYNLGSVDKKIFDMTGKAHPRILFIGFSERSNFTFGSFKKNFMELGAMCEYLKHTELSNAKTIESKTKRADAIYIGGGNSAEFMENIKSSGLDEHLKMAAERGVILCGMSAGAICYSRYGMSDLGENEVRDYKKVEGLGITNLLFCPHYSSTSRREKLPEFLKGLNTVAVGADNCSALVVDGENFEVVKSDDSAKVYSCKISDGKFSETEILGTGKLDEIL